MVYLVLLIATIAYMAWGLFSEKRKRDAFVRLRGPVELNFAAFLSSCTRHIPNIDPRLASCFYFQASNWVGYPIQATDSIDNEISLLDEDWSDLIKNVFSSMGVKLGWNDLEACKPETVLDLVRFLHELYESKRELGAP